MIKKTQKKNKDIDYNKKRKPLFRVEISTADDEEYAQEMFKMKDDIIEKSGTAKKGVIDMYRFAKEKGFFDK